ncbi:MAG: response regulator [Rhodothermales bacterium]
MLGRLGHTVEPVTTGKEAFEKASSSYDLIFMDMMMPVMDGLEATRLIRQYEEGRRRTPIVAVTANAERRDEQTCTESQVEVATRVQGHFVRGRFAVRLHDQVDIGSIRVVCFNNGSVCIGEVEGICLKLRVQVRSLTEYAGEERLEERDHDDLAHVGSTTLIDDLLDDFVVEACVGFVDRRSTDGDANTHFELDVRIGGGDVVVIEIHVVGCTDSGVSTNPCTVVRKRVLIILAEEYAI